MLTHPVLKSIFQGRIWGITRCLLVVYFIKYLLLRVLTKTLFDHTVSIDQLLFQALCTGPRCTVLHCVVRLVPAQIGSDS